MIESIFSSKLFLSSSRKSDIISAVSNPLNQGLVEQLAEYVDPIYLEPEDNAPESSDSDNKNGTKAEDGAVKEESSTAVNNNSTTNGTKVKDTDNQPDKLGQSEAQEELGESSESDVDTKDDETEDVNTSTNISASAVVDVVKSLGLIKDLLNSRESLKGVYRTNIKDHEFWIYYSGDVNLNNVMGSVIELLNASCYSYLEFNRLSRSDNAIIFEVAYPEFLSDKL